MCVYLSTVALQYLLIFFFLLHLSASMKTSYSAGPTLELVLSIRGSTVWEKMVTFSPKETFELYRFAVCLFKMTLRRKLAELGPHTSPSRGCSLQCAVLRIQVWALRAQSHLDFIIIRQKFKCYFVPSTARSYTKSEPKPAEKQVTSSLQQPLK